MEDLDLGWLAGIIDGEGSIMLCKNSRNGYRHPRITVSSTDIEILHYVQSLVGGSIISKSLATGSHRRAWEWRLNGSGKVIELLDLLESYLKCPKKRRRSHKIRAEYRVLTSRNGSYTPEQKLSKQRFEREFFEL